MKNLTLKDFQEVYDEVMNNRKVGLCSAMMYVVEEDKLFAECLISENDFIIYSEHVEHVDLDYYKWHYETINCDTQRIAMAMYMDYIDSKLKYVGERWC